MQAHARKEELDAEKEKARLASLESLNQHLREADDRRAKHLDHVAHPNTPNPSF